MTASTLLLAALHDEMKVIAGRLRGRPDITTLVTGPWHQRMIAGLVAQLERERPARIILLGYCGALSPHLAAGDIVQPAHVIDLGGNAFVLGDGPPRIDAKDAPRDERTTLITIDYVITSGAMKRDLGALHRAAIVDMESHHVAALAAERGIPLTIIRAVSDPMDFDLPAGIGGWVKPDGKAAIGAVLRDLARRPTLLPTLLKLQSHAKTAARNLAAAVGELS